MVVLPLIYLLGLILAFLLAVRITVALFSPKLRSHIRRHWIAHAVVMAFVLGLWFLPWGNIAGSTAGKIDAGNNRIRLYGYSIKGPVKTRIAFSRILRERYGIHSPPLRGCIVFSSNEIRFERAYDAVMIPAIQAKYGRDILAECERAAQDETGDFEDTMKQAHPVLEK